MNKQEALIILKAVKDQQKANEEFHKESFQYDNFITLWTTYEQRSIRYCNTVNEALEELAKINDTRNSIALEIDDDFIGDFKDWSCSLE